MCRSVKITVINIELGIHSSESAFSVPVRVAGFVKSDHAMKVSNLQPSINPQPAFCFVRQDGNNENIRFEILSFVRGRVVVTVCPTVAAAAAKKEH